MFGKERGNRMSHPKGSVLAKCLKILEGKNYKDLDPEASRDRSHMEAIYLTLDGTPRMQMWQRKDGCVTVMPLGEKEIIDNVDSTQTYDVNSKIEFGYVEVVKGEWRYSNWRRCPDDDTWTYHHSGRFEARLVICQPGWQHPGVTDMVSVSTIPVGERRTAVFEGKTPDLNEFHFMQTEECRLLPPTPFALEDTPAWLMFEEKRKAREKLIQDRKVAKRMAVFEQNMRWIHVPPQRDPLLIFFLSIHRFLKRIFTAWRNPTSPQEIIPPKEEPDPASEVVVEEEIEEEEITVVDGYACRLYMTMELME